MTQQEDANYPQAYGVSVPVEQVQRNILVARGVNVMLDEDVAALYGVSREALLEAVEHKKERFPDDFVFQLNDQECAALKSQKLLAEARESCPHVFTEQGVAMVSSVLDSPRAIQIGIEMMRTLIQLREALAGREDLSQHLHLLEQRYDSQFKQVFDALNRLTPPLPEEPKRRLGFPIPSDSEHHRSSGPGPTTL
jgi:ORF6N domain